MESLPQPLTQQLILLPQQLTAENMLATEVSRSRGNPSRLVAFQLQYRHRISGVRCTRASWEVILYLCPSRECQRRWLVGSGQAVRQQ